MCFRKIFHKHVPTPLELPHPEEPPDLTRTMENTTQRDVEGTLYEWVHLWDTVARPDYYLCFTKINLTPAIPAPAQSYDLGNGIRGIDILPQWLNSGVLAHEMAHGSYALLTEKEKASWPVDFARFQKDPLIKLLIQQHPYALASAVEAHAEVYRYLGRQMPQDLQGYYPRLL
jgi:hypothetical protein